VSEETTRTWVFRQGRCFQHVLQPLITGLVGRFVAVGRALSCCWLKAHLHACVSSGTDGPWFSCAGVDSAGYPSYSDPIVVLNCRCLWQCFCLQWKIEDDFFYGNTFASNYLLLPHLNSYCVSALHLKDMVYCLEDITWFMWCTGPTWRTSV